MASPQTKKWWKDAVVYQIYPSSFKDSNDDGIGDLQGIISKLPYLKDLGTDVIWCSPCFTSPWIDNGYDISDYKDINPEFGTLQDMEELIRKSHELGMKLILDLVINHTSDQHEWFKESRSSKDNPKRDWYIWKPPRYAEGGTRLPPNNWRSHFSGSTWEWDEHTQEYYLHLFAKEQPDLNWENAATRKAIYADSMTFWLERGVDGFRIDCVNMYSKGLEYEDAPIFNDKMVEQPAWMIYCNGPRMHEFLKEMHQEVLGKYDVMTVGELPHTPDVKKVLDYVGVPEQLNMVFQFDIVDIGQGLSYKYQFQEWKLPVLKEIVTKWQQFIDGTDGWTTVFCENHDQGRSVTRFASDAPEYRALSAKMLAMMMCCLTGTLFIYQGQEIGMINIPKDWPIEEYQDIESLNFYRTIASNTNNDKEALDYVMRSIQILGRDNARTPMQWDDSTYAGFMDGKKGKQPWMRVNDVYPEINVAKQLKEPDSVLKFWKMMIQLRKKNKALFTHGSFHVFDMHNEATFVFSKKAAESTALLVLNFSNDPQEVTPPPELATLEFQLSNYPTLNDSNGSVGTGKIIHLRPWEGRLYEGNTVTTNGHLSG